MDNIKVIEKQFFNSWNEINNILLNDTVDYKTLDEVNDIILYEGPYINNEKFELFKELINLLTNNIKVKGLLQQLKTFRLDVKTLSLHMLFNAECFSINIVEEIINKINLLTDQNVKNDYIYKLHKKYLYLLSNNLIYKDKIDELAALFLYSFYNKNVTKPDPSD